MRTRSLIIPAVVTLLMSTVAAQAQEATERFIPVGQSPGLSSRYTYIGTIERVATNGQTVTVSGPQGEFTSAITQDTKIWLDRSALQQTALSGTPGDLTQGATVEVKYADYETRESVAWIKVALGRE